MRHLVTRLLVCLLNSVGSDAVVISSGGVPGAAISASMGHASSRWQWIMPEESDPWPAQTGRARERALRGSAALSEDLDRLMVDDAPDTYLHKNLSEFKRKLKANPYFWEALCNGTNPATATQQADESLPLEGWNVAESTSCAVADQLGDGHVYTDELKARMMCGIECSAVIDVGCARNEFKLCKMGAVEETGGADCLRRRLPDHKPYESISRAPMKPAFWKTLCGRLNTHFQLLFRMHVCSSGTTLADATSELECAEIAKNKSSECSETFDFQPGPPAVCRCVPAGGSCNPQVVTEPGDVYSLG